MITKIKYPHPCTRCGFCCTTTVCMNAVILGADPYKPCPHFEIGTDEARCRLIEMHPESADSFGIDAGCCIKARVIARGVEHDFASLPAELKRAVALEASDSKAGAFITDLGQSHTLISDDAAKIILPRYGAWQWDHGKGKHQVVEVSDDVEYLKTKYRATKVVLLTEEKA